MTARSSTLQLALVVPPRCPAELALVAVALLQQVMYQRLATQKVVGIVGFALAKVAIGMQVLEDG
jgi:hypothetical protein